MGYNVLVLDTDVLLFNDIYRWFKARPFSDYHIFTSSEDGGMRAWNINVGVVYVQNARPDGPAAWWLAEVGDVHVHLSTTHVGMVERRAAALQG